MTCEHDLSAADTEQPVHYLCRQHDDLRIGMVVFAERDKILDGIPSPRCGMTGTDAVFTTHPADDAPYLELVDAAEWHAWMDDEEEDERMARASSRYPSAHVDHLCAAAILSLLHQPGAASPVTDKESETGA